VLLPLASFTEVVLGIHIVAVVVAFGVTFAYPIVFAYGMRLDPRHMGWWFRVERRIGQVLITPALAVIVIAGIYLASKEHQWSHFYVQWGLAVALVLGALGGVFFAPNELRAAELAERDIAASAGSTDVKFSAEYQAVTRRIAVVGSFVGLLVLVTVLIMALHV
jgi:ABC-type multidrug transport system permease subunit